MMTSTTTETTLKVSRVIKAPRERVYNAFLDTSTPEMEAFVPNQSPGRPMRTELHEFEPRVGGRYRVSMIADVGPAEGTHTAYGRFLELVTNERIVESHNWEGDPDAAETKVTITFRDVPDGTEVTIVHEGLPGRDSVEGHLGGWTEALENLAKAF